MSYIAVASLINDGHGEPFVCLAAATLALAVDDLRSSEHRADAFRFLHSEEAEGIAGVLGLDYFSIWQRVQRLVGPESKIRMDAHRQRRGAVKLGPDEIGAAEAAKILGVTRDTLYLRSMQGHIPHTRRGRFWVYARSEIEALTQRRRKVE